jgi:eukaryotic-like serine/threonine-protein kinase
MPLEAKTRLGPYEILSPLGAGGMGEVYRAKDTRLDRFVAIKVLPEHLAQSPDALARFEREAKAVAALNHPNILALHDIGTQDGTTYAVMELLEGESLRARLSQGPLPPRKATDLAIQMAQGLAAAHEKGVVHRDLKPENLWITTDGRLKILDFGLARVRSTTAPSSENPTQSVGEMPAATDPGTVLGTVGYMSPEQVRGLVADARSDIFSFGVVLYEMLSGSKAFARDTAAETMTAILKEDPPEFEASGRPLSPGLQRVVHHCLEKDPAHRFRDAHDLAFALENVLGSSGAGGTPALPAAPHRPNRWVLAFLLVGVAVLGALAGWLARRPQPEPTWTQLTFRRGEIYSARFTPDGQSVVYSATWDDKPSDLFLARLDGTATRSLGLPKAGIMAVDGRGDLLVLLKDEKISGMGTLAVVPLEGGTPRELLARVKSADFGPDGKEVAAIYQPVPGGPQRLDFPLGKTLFEMELPYMYAVRVSPRGDLLAISYYDADTDSQVLALVDRQGKRRALHSFSRAVEGDVLNTGPVWSSDGRELYFNSGERLRAVDLRGGMRTLGKDSGLYTVFDVSVQGRVLRERVFAQKTVVARRDGRDVDLSFSNWTDPVALSADGSQALINAYGSVGGDTGMVGIRRTDGSPPKFLGPGTGMDQSPDGKWVVIQPAGVTEHLDLVPTGLGASRELRHPGWVLQGAFFLPDRRHVLVAGRPSKGNIQYLRFPLEGGAAEVLPAKVSFESSFGSEDGRQLLVLDEQRRPVLRPLDGGADKVLAPPLAAGESLLGWDLRDRVLVRQAGQPSSVTVDLLDLKTGTRKPWQVVGPADPSLVSGIYEIGVSTDFKTLVYSYRRGITADLFVMDGIR